MMRRLLTLLTLTMLGAMAQPPDPSLTAGSPNGLFWRDMSPHDRNVLVNGLMSGFIQGAYSVPGSQLGSQHGDCYSSVKASLPAWFHSKVMTGDIVKEMDSFYQDGANIGLPVDNVFEYTEMRLAGG